MAASSGRGIHIACNCSGLANRANRAPPHGPRDPGAAFRSVSTRDGPRWPLPGHAPRWFGAILATTKVEIVPGLLRNSDAESVGRGATLALRCTMCHGARAISPAGSPNLAGQYPIAIYQQLEDFKTGARVSAIMQPLVARLSDQDLGDLAAYHAYLPRPQASHPTSAGPAPALVLSGAPMRNIAPCGACHGDLDHKAASPWLTGEPAAYLAAQLRAFAAGTRHNDIDGQMRNVARQTTPAEIEAAAGYYATRELPEAGRGCCRPDHAPVAVQPYRRLTKG